MSGMIKYRVHEVGKDFGKTSKEITQILTDYATTPKNHMQVLEDPELNVIFEYLTQHNQIESLEEVFKVPPKGGKAQGDRARRRSGGGQGSRAGGRCAACSAAEAGEGAKAPCAPQGRRKARCGHARRDHEPLQV